MLYCLPEQKLGVGSTNCGFDLGIIWLRYHSSQRFESLFFPAVVVEIVHGFVIVKSVKIYLHAQCSGDFFVCFFFPNTWTLWQ